MSVGIHSFTWQRVIVFAVGVHVFGKLFARRMFPEHISMGDVWFAFTAIIAVRFAIEIRFGYLRYADNRKNGGAWARSMSSVLPPGLVKIYRLNKMQWLGFLSWAFRTVPPGSSMEAGEVFEHYPRGQYRTLFLIAILALAVELPIIGLVVGLVEQDPSKKQIIHVLSLAFSVVTIVWLIGDRQLIRSTYHVVSQTSLHLHVGARFNAVIPLSAIEEVFLIRFPKELCDSKTTWLKRNGLPQKGTLSVTPIDTPNVGLKLRDVPDAYFESSQSPTEKAPQIVIYVDESTNFVRHLTSRIKALDARSSASTIQA